MELKLYSSDLKKSAKDIHLHLICYEHFNEAAQSAIKLVGRAVYYNNHGGYHAVHPPKNSDSKQ